MRPTLSLVVLVLTLTHSAAKAQTTIGPRPEFEVVSIKQNVSNCEQAIQSASPASRMYRCYSLRNLMSFAYSLRPEIDEISGLPGWADSERYDIEAKAANEILPPNDRLMLQSLFRTRFKLSVRFDAKTTQSYELVVDKDGPKNLQEVAGNAPRDRNVPPQQTTPHGTILLTGQSRMMSGLAQYLQMQLGVPVTNKTGLTGFFNFKLEHAPPNQSPDIPGASIFTALQEQLGLKLESQKTLSGVVVVEHVEKPTINQ